MPRIQHTTKENKIKAIIIITIALAVYITGAIFSVYYFGKKRVRIDATDFDPTLMDSSIKPQGDMLTGIIIPDASDKEGQIKLAIQLYTIANSNLQNDSRVAFAVNTNTEVMGVKTGGIRYTIKNGNEFFNGDYFFVPQDGAGMIAKKASPEYTNYGYRRYYNLSKNIGYEQKAKELSFTTTASGEILFGVDWTDLYFENKIDIPQEFVQSGVDYKYYNYIWDEDTILEASVKYENTKGYYEIVVKLDCKNEKTITDEGKKALADGAGDKDAVYTSIVETVQIWDNGRYKVFNTLDSWYSPHIHGLPFSTSSANDYKTTFYYDSYSLNISNYQYAKEFIEYIQNK